MYIFKILYAKKFFKILYCWHLDIVGILKVIDEHSRFRIRGSRSGSTPKCHGSATMVQIMQAGLQLKVAKTVRTNGKPFWAAITVQNMNPSPISLPKRKTIKNTSKINWTERCSVPDPDPNPHVQCAKGLKWHSQNRDRICIWITVPDTDKIWQKLMKYSKLIL